MPSRVDFPYFGLHTAAQILIRFCVSVGLGSSCSLLTVIDKVRAISARLHVGAPAETATILAELQSGGSEGVG